MLRLISLILFVILCTPNRVYGGLPEIELQQFKPAPGASDYLNLFGTTPLPHLSLNYGLYMNMADAPLRMSAPGNPKHRTVDTQFTFDLLVAAGFFDLMEVGLVLPVTAYMKSEGLEPFTDSEGNLLSGDQLSTAGLGDIRLSVKGTFLNIIEDPVGLALILIGYFPTGDEGSFKGDQSMGIEPKVALEIPIKLNFRLALNIGFKLRKGTADFRGHLIGNELTYGLGASIPIFFERLALIIEFDGALSFTDDTYGITEVKIPFEAIAGLRYELNEYITISGGMGGGFTKGYGTPSFRWFLGVGGQWVRKESFTNDLDGDGISSPSDQCPDEKEDHDDFQDEDGCPDLDNDKDGVPDELDECNNTSPGESVSNKGCPERDFDGDGVTGKADQCPEESEDPDGFQDDDGCPDYDNDQDGVPDFRDQCPYSKERWNGLNDDDGCSDTNPDKNAYMEGDRIIVKEKIYFQSGKNTIRKVSQKTLDDVAEIMLAHPKIIKIRIEGHTDDRGDDDTNLDLGQERADAVRDFLIDSGVDGDRR